MLIRGLLARGSTFGNFGKTANKVERFSRTSHNYVLPTDVSTSLSGRMSHRIDIELTSQNGDQWTWRAAGARLPKGIVTTEQLYEGAKVGDVVRADAERELDGVRLVSITAPRSAKVGPELLEIIARPQASGVQVIYAEKSSRGREGRGPGGPRGDRDTRPPRGPRPERADRPERGPRPDRPERGPRPDRPEGGSRPDRPAREVRAREDRAARPSASRGGDKRLNPGRAHRDALLLSLPPEQQAVAEQLFRAGIPAVRQAIIDQNAQRKVAGEAEVPAAPLLALADDLLPRVRQADWLDRASAALDVAGSITLRDLRAVVTQADQSARDDESRAMAAKLREALAARIDGERDAWVRDMESAINEGKTVRAVRLSAKLPDPGAKLNPEITARLVEATNKALAPDTRPDVWAALIEAAAEAPFRRSIEPVGLPTTPGESLLATAAQSSNRIPSLLKLLGLTMPPPPRSKALPPKPPMPAKAPVPPKAPTAPRADTVAVAPASPEIAVEAEAVSDVSDVSTAPVESTEESAVAASVVSDSNDVTA